MAADLLRISALSAAPITQSFRPSVHRDSADPMRIAYAVVVLADTVHLYLHRNLLLATGLWPRFPVGALASSGWPP
jgi:hypothetical protein